MTHICVCKNVIQSNNKNDWKDPKPAIRCSTSKAGKVVLRSNKVGIVDKDGNVVAEIMATTDGKPVISCGAKVGIVTTFDVVDLEDA